MITRDQVLRAIKCHGKAPKGPFFTMGKMDFSRESVREICRRCMDGHLVERISGGSNATPAEIQAVLDTHLAAYLEDLDD